MCGGYQRRPNLAVVPSFTYFVLDLMTTTLPRPQCVSQSLSTQASATREIVFIDPAVTDYPDLVAGVRSNVEVIVLEAMADGVEQISSVLAQRQNLTAVHLLSHGSPGRVQLGTSELSLETIDRYSWQLQAWAEALTNKAELLIYGCEVTQGDRGWVFVNMLHSLTGAIVTDSTTKPSLTSISFHNSKCNLASSDVLDWAIAAQIRLPFFLIDQPELTHNSTSPRTRSASQRLNIQAYITQEKHHDRPQRKHSERFSVFGSAATSRLCPKREFLDSFRQCFWHRIRSRSSRSYSASMANQRFLSTLRNSSIR
jgi:hypothetical protein